LGRKEGKYLPDLDVEEGEFPSDLGLRFGGGKIGG
jgi:hypothetical protein